MQLKKALGNLRKTDSINYLLLVIVIIYSTTFSLWFSGLSSGIVETIGSVTIPNGYFNASLSSSNPRLEVSYSITNRVIYDLTDLKIDLSLDVKYFDKFTHNETMKTVFVRNENIGDIIALQHQESIIIGEEGDFKLESLVEFETNANLSRIIRYFLRVEANGKFFYNSIPFKLKFKVINLYIM